MSSINSAVIKGEELGVEPFDQGAGGVRLTEESAIKITGIVKHKPGQADPDLSELMRFKKMTKLEEATVTSSLGSAKVVATGRGTEFYKDPGETVVSEVTLAPMDAAKDAFTAAASLKDATKICFNFLGGNDLQLLEVLDALTFLIKDCLDINTKAKIYFNSLCFKEFPEESCTVTIVASDSESRLGPGTGVEYGEVYFRDGTWYTLDEQDKDESNE